MTLSDADIEGIRRAKQLLKLVSGLAQPIRLTDTVNREIDTDALAAYLETIGELLPAEI